MKFERRLTYLIKQLQDASRVRLDRCLRDLDLTAAQYAVMSRLRGQEPWSSASLARRHWVTAQTMNEMIGLLERRGLIKREENPANRRILLVTLTQDGHRLLEECDRRVDKLEAEMFGHLPPHALAGLYDTMIDLIERIRDSENESTTAQAAE